METIAVLDAAVLLYLKRLGDGTVPDIVEYLESRAGETPAKHLALQLRSLEARGLVKLVGSRRRNPGRPGPAANLWSLTPKGVKEASALISLFSELLEPVVAR